MGRCGMIERGDFTIIKMPPPEPITAPTPIAPPDSCADGVPDNLEEGANTFGNTRDSFAEIAVKSSDVSRRSLSFRGLKTIRPRLFSLLFQIFSQNIYFIIIEARNNICINY